MPGSDGTRVSDTLLNSVGVAWTEMLAGQAWVSPPALPHPAPQAVFQSARTDPSLNGEGWCYRSVEDDCVSSLSFLAV